MPSVTLYFKILSEPAHSRPKCGLKVIIIPDEVFGVCKKEDFFYFSERRLYLTKRKVQDDILTFQKKIEKYLILS